MEEYDYLVKLVLIGESGVGKSAILNRYCDDFFNDSYISTIGVDFKIKLIDIASKKVKIQIWDTAGQERFRTITTSYYRGSHAVMLVFDVNNYHSFSKLNQWMKEIKTNLTGKYKIILVGNKTESDSHRQVSQEQIDNFTSTYGMDYIEVSAKKNTNIELAFYKLIHTVLTSEVFENRLDCNIPFADLSRQIHGGKKIKKKENKCC